MFRSFFRLFILLACLLLLSSCLFVNGIPMTGDDGSEETWPLNLTGKIPLDNYSAFSPDNMMILTFSNSFDTSRVGQISFSSPPTVFDRFNSSISYATNRYLNDTLIIQPYSYFATSTIYSSISLSGFYDFKGNPVETISDGSYNFKTAASFNPEVVHYVPFTGAKRVTSHLSFKVSFNEPLDSITGGTLSLDSPNIVFQDGVNCTMSLGKGMVPGDTLTIRPNTPLAANRYMGLKIDGFQDKNGNAMTLFENAAFTMQVSGLVAEYHFSNNLEDSTTNGYHGYSNTTVTMAPDRYGNSGQAAKFDGSGSLMHCTNLTNFGDQSGDFTIMLWMSPDTLTPGNRTFLSKDSNAAINSPGTSEVQLDIFNKNIIRFIVGNPVDDWTFAQLRSNTLVEAGKWYHVTAIAADKSMKLYINGNLEDAQVAPRQFSATNILMLGSSDDTEGLPSTTYFAGRLDEVKVYNYPLSADEVANIYNSEKP